MSHRAPSGGRHGRSAPPQRGDPDDLILGAHAAEIVLRHQPERVRAVHLWTRDRGLAARIHALTAGLVGGRGQTPPPLRDAPPEGLAISHLAQGVAVHVRTYPYVDLDALRASLGRGHGPAKPPLLLALDGITDTHNLGAILRSAAFFAVDGVVLPADRAAHVTPAAERIARGGASLVKVAIVTNLARSLVTLADDGFLVVGTGFEEGAVDLWELPTDQPIALVLGAEDAGMRPLVRRHCQRVVRLGGDPRVQSLNVSAFAAVALAALCRPRLG